MTPLGMQNLMPSQAIHTQTALIRSSLALQTYVGSQDLREEWHSALDRTDRLAMSKTGILAWVFRNWDLEKAGRLLRHVETETRASGLIFTDLSDLQAGLANNAARFRRNAFPPAPVTDESSSAGSLLFDRLLSSEVPSHQTLVLLLNRAFQAHIARLDRKVAQMEEVAGARRVPEDAAYPRNFDMAQSQLMIPVKASLAYLNEGGTIPWEDCRSAMMSLLIQRQLEREKIPDVSSANPDEVKRGYLVTLQIPDYSGFQLLCLLLQIRKGGVDDRIVKELRQALNGRIITTDLALKAGIRSRDLLKASELVGNIDIIHANIKTAFELARTEQPDVDPMIVELQVRAGIALLGKATGSSRSEYDEVIGRLHALESRPRRKP